MQGFDVVDYFLLAGTVVYFAYRMIRGSSLGA